MLVPVGGADRVPLDQQAAHLAGWHLLARVVDDPYLVAGDHGAAAVWPHVVDLVGYEDVAALRRTYAIQDVGTGAHLPTPDNRAAQRLARADADPHRTEVGVGPDLRIGGQYVGIARRHAVVDRRLEVPDHIQDRGGRRSTSQENRRRANAKGQVEGVPQTIGEVELCD